MPESEADNADTLERDRLKAFHRMSRLAERITNISVELTRLEIAVADTNGDAATARQALNAVVAADF